MISTAQLVCAKSNGYTILFATTGPIIASWQMAGKATTYGLKDMKPVGLSTLVPAVIVLNASSPIWTYQDRLAQGTRRPGGPNSIIRPTGRSDM